MDKGTVQPEEEKNGGLIRGGGGRLQGCHVGINLPDFFKYLS